MKRMNQTLCEKLLIREIYISMAKAQYTYIHLPEENITVTKTIYNDKQYNIPQIQHNNHEDDTS